MIKRTPARAAFTLIELLVVISIIAVLVGLLVVGVLPMLRKGPDLKDVNEISQISIAVQAFKNKYKVFPPSMIKLCSNRNEYVDTQALDKESLAYLNQIWPRLNISGVPWNGATLPNGGVTLYGDQCLVFFLGGPGGTEGFSTSSTNPCQSGGERVKFYDFAPNRLVDRLGDRFPSFVDNWANSNTSGNPQVFAYFSSGKKSNGYNSGSTMSHGITSLGGVRPLYSAYTVVSGTRTGFKYLNPDTFQILAAGRDGIFNSLPPPSFEHWNNGSSDDGATGWQDNRSNFSPNILAASSN